MSSRQIYSNIDQSEIKPDVNHIFHDEGYESYMIISKRGERVVTGSEMSAVSTG